MPRRVTDKAAKGSLTKGKGTKGGPPAAGLVTPTKSVEPPPLTPSEAACIAWAEALRLGERSLALSLTAAGHLAEAGFTMSREEWAEWLPESGIHPIAAARLLTLHRLALDVPAVAELGGIVLTELWAAQATLPAEGTVLAITLGEWHPDRPVPAVYVWRAAETPEGFHAGRIDLAGPAERSLATRGAITDERDLWATVWHFLGHRFADMIFRPITRDADRLVERLEARRQALLSMDTRVVH